MARSLSSLGLCAAFIVTVYSLSATAADQAQLCQEIRASGGEVILDAAHPQTQVHVRLDALELSMPKVSAWLPRLREIDNLTKLELVNSQLSSDDVRHLAEIKSLRRLSAGFSRDACRLIEKLSQVEDLNLAFSELTLEGYKQLGGLAGLKRLELRQCNVSDEALRALCNSPSLESLGLMETAVTDEGVKGLAGLKTLRYLSLEVTQVTSVGVQALRDLPKLEWLDLYSTQVDDKALPDIARIKTLQALILDNTLVTDAGLPALAALPKLQRLNLNGTQVSDTGLKSLARLASLRVLVLDKDGPIHGAAFAQLGESLPLCKISRL